MGAVEPVDTRVELVDKRRKLCLWELRPVTLKWGLGFRRLVLFEVDVEREQFALAVWVQQVVPEGLGAAEVRLEIFAPPRDAITVAVLRVEQVRRPAAVGVLNGFDVGPCDEALRQEIGKFYRQRISPR